METETEMEFREDLQAANELYKDGKYPEAIRACSLALKYTHDVEEIAVTLDQRGWAARYDGFKSKDEAYGKAAYKIAKEDWRKVLEISSDINLKTSAIKGLMLLPEEDGEELFQMGMAAIDRYTNDLKAELGNSYGLMVRQEDPIGATKIFRDAYRMVEKGTVIAGHLMQNLGTCLLIRENDESDPRWKRVLGVEAVECLEIAMEEYPESQIEHRRSTQGKIDRTNEEIKMLERELEE